MIVLLEFEALTIALIVASIGICYLAKVLLCPSPEDYEDNDNFSSVLSMEGQEELLRSFPSFDEENIGEMFIEHELPDSLKISSPIREGIGEESKYFYSF